jgi:diguanylate cyclase (GGDEF)-like protein
MATDLTPGRLPLLPRSRIAALLLAAGMIALIGRLDFATGFETSVIILYLLPITLVAWVAGPWWGVIASAASAVLSLIGDSLAIAGSGNPLVPYWNAAVQFSVFALFALALAALRASLAREHRASRVDFGTGLSNWRAFYESAEAELARVRRFGRSLTLVYMDCDDFKNINDTLGHAEGDRVLRTVADSLLATTREIDTVARLGGDEFVVMLPETGPEAAERAVERMRRSLLEHAGAAGTAVTVSMGAATFREPPDSLDEMIRAADRLLYEAKSAGGDRAAYGTYGTC